MEAHTPPLPPAAPEAPALADIPKSRSLTVAWTIPACRGAYVTAYHLEVAEAEAAAAGGSEKAWERKYTGGDTLREVSAVHTSSIKRLSVVMGPGMCLCLHARDPIGPNFRTLNLTVLVRRGS